MATAYRDQRKGNRHASYKSLGGDNGLPLGSPNDPHIGEAKGQETGPGGRGNRQRFGGDYADRPDAGANRAAQAS